MTSFALVFNSGKIKQTAGIARPTRKPPCVDTFQMCYGWSRLGYCSSNTRQRFMEEYCKRSCNLCSTVSLEYISTYFTLCVPFTAMFLFVALFIESAFVISAKSK